MAWLLATTRAGSGGGESGAGDQSTYIVPSKDLVIVVMSHRGRASRARNQREDRALGMIVKAVDSSWRWVDVTDR